ncbi:YitT family protein [Streptomyces sp. NPDC058762]|uniref:membrane protein YczE n=1 Tax=Streptomyces sp. NPDC058762 TaxID=3346629 RepID=UPI0036AAB89C
MRGAGDRVARRSALLLSGLTLYGVSTALLVRAGLGTDPWTVLTQGVAHATGLSLGAVMVVISAVLFALWVPLRQRPGIGTIANAALVGPVLDLALRSLPVPGPWPWRLLFLLAGVVGTSVATGLYVGAGWGPGPRDGLMTGLARLGVPVLVARTLIEISVLLGGWLLGGTVGIGTAVYAAGIGPLVAFFLPRLALKPTQPQTAAATTCSASTVFRSSAAVRTRRRPPPPEQPCAK